MTPNSNKGNKKRLMDDTISIFISLYVTNPINNVITRDKIAKNKNEPPKEKETIAKISKHKKVMAFPYPNRFIFFFSTGFSFMFTNIINNY